jgi:hypothetical protein
VVVRCEGGGLGWCRSSWWWSWSSDVREWRVNVGSVVVGGEGMRSGVFMVAGGGN